MARVTRDVWPGSLVIFGQDHSLFLARVTRDFWPGSLAMFGQVARDFWPGSLVMFGQGTVEMPLWENGHR